MPENGLPRVSGQQMERRDKDVHLFHHQTTGYRLMIVDPRESCICLKGEDYIGGRCDWVWYIFVHGQKAWILRPNEEKRLRSAILTEVKKRSPAILGRLAECLRGARRRGKGRQRGARLAVNF